MKAKFINLQENGKNLSGDKELISSYSVVAIYKGELYEAITVSCYIGRSSPSSLVHASIWVRPADASKKWCSGYGTATGYGYHKESAAIGDAIDSAGIELYGDIYGRVETAAKAKQRAYINGVGDIAVREALKAIARAAGYRGKLLIVTN